MSNNKHSKEKQAEDSSVNELDQLRQIVFGAAEQKLQQQLATTKHDFEQALKTQNNHFNNRLDTLQKDISARFSSLEQQLQSTSKNHENNEAVIEKNLANLATEHEMFATTTQQDFKAIEQSLDSESQLITRNFNEQIEQLKIHLESVSKELTSTKTDRKTLAKLLATMATNLEDDEL